MRRWYAVYTQPRSEQKAATHLRNQGFEIYLPVENRRRSHARRIEIVRAPFFPRYLFVAVDVETARWRAINSTVGAVGMVQTGDRPAAVPEEVIAALRAREDANGAIDLRRPDFPAGTPLRVTNGPLADVVGLFELGDDDRVTLLLELLGRPVRVRVPRDAVAAA